MKKWLICLLSLFLLCSTGCLSAVGEDCVYYEEYTYERWFEQICSDTRASGVESPRLYGIAFSEPWDFAFKVLPNDQYYFFCVRTEDGYRLTFHDEDCGSNEYIKEGPFDYFGCDCLHTIQLHMNFHTAQESDWLYQYYQADISVPYLTGDAVYSHDTIAGVPVLLREHRSNGIQTLVWFYDGYCMRLGVRGGMDLYQVAEDVIREFRFEKIAVKDIVENGTAAAGEIISLSDIPQPEPPIGFYVLVGAVVVLLPAAVVVTVILVRRWKKKQVECEIPPDRTTE